MTFDFFNTSNLAFGGKLTTAFKQLFNQVEQAQDNIDSVLERQAIYSQYLFKNYIVGQPTNGSNPCRTNEILNLIKDINYIGDIEITFSGDNENTTDTLVVNANVYDKSLNIVSKISASKTLTVDDWHFSTVLGDRALGSSNAVLRYFLFFKPATDNMSMIVNCRLSEENDIQEGEELLFKVIVNPLGVIKDPKISISSPNPRYNFITGSFNNYNKLALSSLNAKSGAIIGNNQNYILNYNKYFTDIEKNTVTPTGAANPLTYISKATASRNCMIGIRLLAGTDISVNGVTRYKLKKDNSRVINTYTFIGLKKGDVIEFNMTYSGKDMLGNTYTVKGLDVSRLYLVTYSEN